ncbi:hypothetical protein PVL29_022599 [Vitis rotundifolia]|uniref:Uncharacterized protein n=1 Tax=Vitis rotundifolia TaxID=103349 RepID=A0AA39DBR4_VITRO|nr:hypothetical protein PVL29_022599 [Vitis rotundifolia]
MKAIVVVGEAILILSIEMIVLLVVYFFLLWCFALRNQFEWSRQERQMTEGFSTLELKKLSKLVGKKYAGDNHGMCSVSRGDEGE